MSENDRNNLSKSIPFQQRRAKSADEFALQILNDENLKKKTLLNGSHEIIQEYNDDYICAPLPRTNNRPSARTCWRSRPVFAPSPKCNFGPKGTLKKIQNNDQLIVIQDPSTQRLHWISTPNHILIIRKPGPTTLKEFQTLIGKLLRRHLNVYIESSDQEYLSVDNNSDLKKYAEQFIVFDQGDLPKIDLIICLGGDGTLLHASSIFQKSCPPILSFSMGSLGFLTPFDFKSHEKILNEVLAGNVAVLLRSRLSCTINKKTSDNTSTPTTPDISSRTNDTIKLDHEDNKTCLVLNEVVIDRGPNSYLSNLDLFINDRFITKVQGDGLIISTPTGSTAYAMAAGASMVHPNVPSMVICPICPHSLSFRPIVVPAGIELVVKVSEDTRLSAWLSVDGRNRLELNQEDSIKITTSVYPIPSICRFDQLGDWFESLADILHWNLRKPQSSFDIDEENQSNEKSDSQEDENKNSSLSETDDLSKQLAL
ncbi:unnamed protein product [Adineta steineri]|uniref:NAD(+) kinase n=1 Tax=Adineta steineri TaxID=433720 RepID=A0A813PKJ8_9BILA|nr:unnamed protein product [Adineta steineri]CAF0868132.1 unnamed protein product [Adineta steineri]